MVQAQSGAISTESRVALSAQAAQIRDEVIGLYNATYLDRPVFGGTVPGRPAVDPTTGAYLGNEQPIRTRISRDATIRLDVRGSDVGADTMPAILDRIVTDLASPAGVPAADFTDLDAGMSKVLQALGDIGARSARVDSTKTNVDSERLDLKTRISENEDVDLPATIMNLQAQQVGYQSALGASAKILQVSLLDFLK